MRVSRAWLGLVGALAALAPLSLASAQPAARPVRAHARAISLGTLGGIGSFTPAAADAGGSAATLRSLGGAGLGSTGFRFTPSTAPGRSRAVTVAVRARSNHLVQTSPAERLASGAPSTASAVTPAVYDLGISLGWKRFALSGDVGRIEGSLLPIDRESADVGLTYSGRRWSTRLMFGADRSTVQRPLLLGPEQSYSVDLAGSYALTRGLDVMGGVRYKSELDTAGSVADTRRDSQAVYVGTAFRF